MQGFLDHIVLNIEDDETIIDFYTRVLMLPAERLEDYRAGRSALSFRSHQSSYRDRFISKEIVGIRMSGRIKESSNLNHFCLSLIKKDWEDYMVGFLIIGFLSEKGLFNGGELREPEHPFIFPILKEIH